MGGAWNFGLGLTMPPLLWLLSAADPVDVLKAVGVKGGQAGAPQVPGFCPQRTPEGDQAFRLDKTSMLSVPTRQLFPGELRQEGAVGPLSPRGHAVL